MRPSSTIIVNISITRGVGTQEWGQSIHKQSSNIPTLSCGDSLSTSDYDIANFLIQFVTGDGASPMVSQPLLNFDFMVFCNVILAYNYCYSKFCCKCKKLLFAVSVLGKFFTTLPICTH